MAEQGSIGLEHLPFAMAGQERFEDKMRRVKAGTGYHDAESIWTPGGVGFSMEMWRTDDNGGWLLLLYRGDDEEPVFRLEGRDDGWAGEASC